MRPDVIVFDESTAMLDPLGRREIMSIAKDLNDQGITVIMVTHNMDSACELADRIVALCDGKIVADGSPKEVFGDRNLIKEIGLDVPFVARVVDRLEREGVSLDKSILSVDELVSALDEYKRLKGGESHV